MTGVINGVPQCVTPSTGKACPAKTLFVIAIDNPLVSGSASPRQTVTRSFIVPETQSAAAPIPFTAEIVFTLAGGTKRNTFSGSAFCGNGEWYCSIGYFFYNTNYSGSYGAGGSYVNGLCIQPSNRGLAVLNSTY